jgi:hypothetical protein
VAASTAPLACRARCSNRGRRIHDDGVLRGIEPSGGEIAHGQRGRERKVHQHHRHRALLGFHRRLHHAARALAARQIARHLLDGKRLELHALEDLQTYTL